jgi:hypothetical protein
VIGLAEAHGSDWERDVQRFAENCVRPLAGSREEHRSTADFGLQIFCGAATRNIAESFTTHGCNLTFGFVKKVSFAAAESGILPSGSRRRQARESTTPPARPEHWAEL